MGFSEKAHADSFGGGIAWVISFPFGTKRIDIQ